MSDMAKQARAAMKAKASKMTSADPHQKVDSSTWTPPEALNTEVKTGLRPISRRAFKSGGKVTGVKAKVNLGKAIRGGNKPLTPDNLANKDVKAANEDRAGIKHVGALKTGGRAKKSGGGGRGERMPLPPRRPDYLGKIPAPAPSPEDAPISPAMRQRMQGIVDRDAAASRGANAAEQAKQDYEVTGQKRGGKVAKCWGGKARAKKMLGGPMTDPTNPAGVQNKALKFGQDVVTPGLKKGGAAKHDDVKQDMALIKKMVKPSARKAHAAGGSASHESYEPTPKSSYESHFDRMGAKKGGRTARKDGGGVFSGPGYPGKVPGVTGGRIAHATRGRVKTADDIAAEYAMRGPDEAMQSIVHGGIPPHMAKAYGQSAMRDADLQAMYDAAMSRSMQNHSYGAMMSGDVTEPEMAGVDMPRRNGGRTARATGGKTKGKGKTNINIVIATGKPAGQQGMMNPGDIGPTPPPGAGAGPQGMPVPIPAAAGAGAGAAPMPMPIPMPMPMGGAGGGQPPMARKSGGRITKVASSYKDMEAGSGGGEGRLQKTDIAKKHKDAPAFKKGGKVYRSYKDMDAGAGSGMGRLEKTEIQARKG
jgi:hypothetical protein